MPTTKQRINLTVSPALYRALDKLALRDETTLSSKALELIENALEIEEDGRLLRLAESRDTPNTTLISHTKAWL